MRYLKNVVTLEYNPKACIGCGLCPTVCPHSVFAMNGKRAEILDRDACMECGACARNCPVGAIQVKSGVGCATGILNSIYGIGSDCCSQRQSCCQEDSSKSTTMKGKVSDTKEKGKGILSKISGEKESCCCDVRIEEVPEDEKKKTKKR